MAESARHREPSGGLTTLSVDYHRPGVNKRVVWGGLVPWDSVWRAGANENTVLASTSAFTIGGTTLPAGRYGLFMIPGRDRWTVILSRQANAWGAFSYDPAEDAVRFSVTPAAAEFTERLQYNFDDPTNETVTLTMRWEKLAVSFPVSVNTSVVVLDSLEESTPEPAQVLGSGLAAGGTVGTRQHVGPRPGRALGGHGGRACRPTSPATT